MKWLLTIITIGYLACPVLVNAQTSADTTIVYLRKAQMKSGVTVTHSTGTVSVGIPAAALTGTRHASVKIKPVADSTKYLYTNGDLLSEMYRYSITGGANLTLTQALWLQMSYPGVNSSTDKVLKYWNASVGKWKPVHHVTDFSDQWYIRGTLHRRSAVIAVFSKPIPVQTTDGTIVQGIASWYDGSGAASNDFPMGSIIRITNVATGVYVDATVVSTGPFVTGRIVDLTRSDFSAIANLSAGVVEVTVQLAPQ